MKTRIYVAGASSEMERAKSAMAALRELGYEITSTWIESIERVGDANPREASRDERAAWSKECLLGVRSSDVLWLLVPSDYARSAGSWIELGAVFGASLDAFAYGLPLTLTRRTVASGDTKRSIFLAHAEEFATDEAALAWIKGNVDVEAEIQF